MARSNFDPQILSARGRLWLRSFGPRRGRVCAQNEPGDPFAPGSAGKKVLTKTLACHGAPV